LQTGSPGNRRGQGVGQGIAYALAQEGARVAVTGRTFAKLEQTCAEIKRRGGQALAVECDVKEC
jgi:NAD(P)-dependent dehydrogenase (short-subunit alcohol dehydrogenase family)